MKNLVLSGVHITMVDQHIINERDVETMLFLTDEDIGKHVLSFFFVFLFSCHVLFCFVLICFVCGMVERKCIEG